MHLELSVLIALARAKPLNADVRSPCASLDPHVLPCSSKSFEKSLPDGTTHPYAFKFVKNADFISQRFLRDLRIFWRFSWGHLCDFYLLQVSALSLQSAGSAARLPELSVLSVPSCAESWWLWKKTLLFRMIRVTEEKPIILWQNVCLQSLFSTQERGAEFSAHLDLLWKGT